MIKWFNYTCINMYIYSFSSSFQLWFITGYWIYSSQCCTVGPCSLSILYIMVCICGDLVAKSCPTVVIPWMPAMLLCPWDSPGENSGVGHHFLLQRIFPTQKSNPGLRHCRHILYLLSYERSPNLHLLTPKLPVHPSLTVFLLTITGLFSTSISLFINKFTRVTF